MDGENRTAAADLKEALLGAPRSYTFFQVLRLLRLLTPDTHPRNHHLPSSIHVRPNLTLKFPEADVERIDEGEGGSFRLTANFLGLYGTSSPLPTFYTEDLIDEGLNDHHAARELIDVLNSDLYPLLFQAWSKTRPLVKLVEERDPHIIERIFGLIGLAEPRLRRALPHPQMFLRYVGLLTQIPRSALGLKTLIADALGRLPVEVVQWRITSVAIPMDQRLAIGGGERALGMDAFLGEEIEDGTTSIGIRIGPLSYEQFKRLLPGAEGYKLLKFLVSFYPMNPVQAEVELTLSPGCAQPICLGTDDYARLGLDTWLSSDDYQRETRTSFWL
jgi:type VI secretion system protein ImpH